MRTAVAATCALVMIVVSVALLSPARGFSVNPAAIGRQARAGGIAVGGGDVYIWSAHAPEKHGGGCTLAFPVRSRGSKKVGVLTAGHCVRTLPGGAAYLVHQTKRLTRDGTDPGDLLGRVERGQARLGKRGDSAFVRLVAHRVVRPEVFAGPVYTSRTIPIAGTAKLRDGLKVCYSGAASGEHCGFTVVGRPAPVWFREGQHSFRIRHEWRATRSSCTSRRGDSGSPVYVRRHGKAYAVGILSGGQETAGRCPFFFTPVSLALKTLGLKLVVS